MVYMSENISLFYMLVFGAEAGWWRCKIGGLFWRDCRNKHRWLSDCHASCDKWNEPTLVYSQRDQGILSWELPQNLPTKQVNSTILELAFLYVLLTRLQPCTVILINFKTTKYCYVKTDGNYLPVLQRSWRLCHVQNMTASIYIA